MSFLLRIDNPSQRWILGVVLGAVAGFASCGDPTDRPEDCTSNQYYDETRKLCVTCPAISLPQCEPGCGFEIVEDRNECPVASCLSGDGCSRCSEREYFDNRTLQCQRCDGPQTCEEGEPTREFVEERCVYVCR